MPSKNTISDFWSHIDKKSPSDCWNWTFRFNHKGYGMFGINGRSVLSHRYVYFLTYGPIPKGLFILHSCNNPPCCNPAHLRIGTHRENMLDMVKSGRSIKGERSNFAKLTQEQVLEIRNLYKTGKYSCKKIGDMFHVTNQSVWAIISNKNWKHI